MQEINFPFPRSQEYALLLGVLLLCKAWGWSRGGEKKRGEEEKIEEKRREKGRGREKKGGKKRREEESSSLQTWRGIYWAPELFSCI